MVSAMEAPQNESRRMKRARLVRDGLSWRAACLQSGYSMATANRGPRGYMENKPGVAKDFERAASEAAYRPGVPQKGCDSPPNVIGDRRKALQRCPRSRTARKDEEVDLFVRNTDVQVGIFAALMEPPPVDLLKAIDDYKD